MSTAWYWLVWPWIGLGGAIALIVLLFGTDVLRSNSGKPRWKDPYWLGWMTAVAYLLHNTEEYGISLKGELHAFPQMMSDLLGIVPPEAFYVAVNISLFWFVGPIAAIMAKKHPAMSLGMSGLLIVNAISHIAPLLLGAGYTPGTLTAIIIFVPASIWTMYICCNRKTGLFSMRCLIWYLFSSIIGHAVLMGSIMLFKTVSSAPPES